jgi:hypothetical protein
MVNIAGRNTNCLLQLQSRLRYCTTHPMPRLRACSLAIKQRNHCTSMPHQWRCYTHSGIKHIT